MARFSPPVAVAIACALLIPQSAAARPAPITGKLDKRGYTLVAIGYDGKSVSTRARSFRLQPRSGRVTLHLRNRHGKYAGPVLVGRRGKRATVGVKAGAHLGLIKVRRGYAQTKRPLSRRFADRKRFALLRRGAPLGNGRNFGLVRSHHQARSGSGAGKDLDLDGVPGAFDIDVDGDRVLNPLERRGARASADSGPVPSRRRPSRCRRTRPSATSPSSSSGSTRPSTQTPRRSPRRRSTTR
jgi:hypothetical protein